MMADVHFFYNMNKTVLSWFKYTKIYVYKIQRESSLTTKPTSRCFSHLQGSFVWRPSSSSSLFPILVDDPPRRSLVINPPPPLRFASPSSSSLQTLSIRLRDLTSVSIHAKTTTEDRTDGRTDSDILRDW